MLVRNMDNKFYSSNWAKAEFVREYRDHADIYVIERRRMLAILRSFYRHYLEGGRQKTVLDLGCGDGIITREILNVDGSASVTLLDGSDDMLDTARERLRDFAHTQFIRASFQDVLEKGILKQDFDFIVSALAIHHLARDEKKSLFGEIYAHLRPGGYFVNIDVVLAPAEAVEDWYMALWKEWINERKISLGADGDYLDEMPRRYKDNKDNKPDTLKVQMDLLREIGFKDVDCFYKYGIFSMFGGRK
jgi:tRNA (cmo5U34)-methyltransferase